MIKAGDDDVMTIAKYIVKQTRPGQLPWPIISWTVIVAIARTYAGYHRLNNLLAGRLLGLAVVYFISLLPNNLDKIASLAFEDILAVSLKGSF